MVLMQVNKKFSAHDLPAAQRACFEYLKISALEFVGKTAHGDGRNKEKQNPGCKWKERLKGGIALVQDIIPEYKQNQPAHQEKNKNGYISGQAAEKLS